MRRALKARIHNTEIDCEVTYNKEEKNYAGMYTWYKDFIENPINQNNYLMKIVQNNELEQKTKIKLISSNTIFKFYLSSDLHNVVSLGYELFIPNYREIVEGSIIEAEFRTFERYISLYTLKCSIEGGSYTVNEL